jgi:hypothetical protein
MGQAREGRRPTSFLGWEKGLAPSMAPGAAAAQFCAAGLPPARARRRRTPGPRKA